MAHSEPESEENRPEWREWQENRAGGWRGIREPMTEMRPGKPVQNRRMPGGGLPGRWPYRELKEDEDVKVFDPFQEGPGGAPMHTTSTRYAVRHAIKNLNLARSTPEQAVAYLVARDEPSIKRVAHDSGNQEIIYHCPFCGSGQVIARSDGTIECEFCQACFTVQVQPEFSAFPQTIDGQPVDVPGMGSDMNPSAPPQDGTMPPGQEDPNADPNGAPVPPGGTEEQPPEEGDDDDDDDEPVDSGGNPLFNKKSFRTAQGAVLDRDHYIQHLALSVTSHRDTVLAAIRKANKR